LDFSICFSRSHASAAGSPAVYIRGEIGAQAVSHFHACEASLSGLQRVLPAKDASLH
jgi:hypothetical protein